MRTPGELTQAKAPFEHYPFVVAEMGANHNQDIDRALAIVDQVAVAGADAIKLQTYTVESMVARGTKHRIEGGPWDGRDLAGLYERGSLPWSWHKRIFERAAEAGILAFSTPFELDAIPFLERLGCPMYKIASSEILDLELIRAAAVTGKPLVISTGMATLEEIDDAYNAARSSLTPVEITLLKCTAAYPAPAAEANLETLNDLRERYGCRVGLSDHTRGSAVAIAAALYEADMIEKHITLRRTDGGLDAEFSAEPEEFAAMVQGVRQAMDAIGQVRFGPTPSEHATLRLRRTLHVTRDLKAGDRLTRENVRALRPADGEKPKELIKFLGMQVTRDVQAGEPLTWELTRSR